MLLGFALLLALIYTAYKTGLISWFVEKADPHRYYMGEKVKRTMVFWTELIYLFIGAFVFSKTGSWLALLVTHAVLHLMDFGFWLFDKNVMKTNPLERKGYGN